MKPMKRNKFIIILLIIIFIIFFFRVGWKVMGLNILDTIEIEGTENIEPSFEPSMEVLNESEDISTGPTKVGTISINPGGVTTVQIER